MIVRRLTQWLTRLCASLTARLRHPAPAAERQTICSGASSSSGSARPYRGSATSGTTGRWLDDAHRLRPRIVPHTEPAWNNHPPEHRLATPSDGERARPLPSRSRPIHATGEETPVPATPEILPARTQPVPPTQPTPSKAGSSTPPAANESDEILDVTLRRRLRSLQFLVRHGVYNEGFSQKNVPEQYRLSLGLDDLDRLFEDE